MPRCREMLNRPTIERLGLGFIVMNNRNTLYEMRELLRCIRVVQDHHDEECLIESLLAVRNTTIVSFFNQHAFNLAFVQPAFRATLRSSTVLLRDGVGVECCMGLLRHNAGRNMNGTDLIPRILAAGKGKRVALFGTSTEWLSVARKALLAQGICVVAALDGFRPRSDYTQAIAESDPDIVLLGMGMPRQELLSSEIAKMPGRGRLIVNGGAILDFYAGRFARAPVAIRAARLEWLYRMLLEPRRLAGRYLVGGFLFCFRLYQLFRADHSSMAEEVR